MLVISTFYIYQRIPKLIMLLFLRLLPEVSTWEEISLSILMQNQFSLCTDMMHYFRDVIQYFFLLMWRIQVRRKYSIRYSETAERSETLESKYRGFSAYANFISANYITAIFLNIPWMPYANFGLGSFHKLRLRLGVGRWSGKCVVYYIKSAN